MLLASGWAFTQWRSVTVDSAMRDRFLSHSVMIAQSINPDRVRSLSFSPADAASGTYQRLCRQLTAARQTIRAGVYCLAFRSGQVVFGPANLERHPARHGARHGLPERDS